jgi:hypothetical protein
MKLGQQRLPGLKSIQGAHPSTLGRARPEKLDLHIVGAHDQDVAVPDWVLQAVAIGPATTRTADIGTGAMASAL